VSSIEEALAALSRYQVELDSFYIHPRDYVLLAPREEAIRLLGKRYVNRVLKWEAGRHTRWMNEGRALARRDYEPVSSLTGAPLPAFVSKANLQPALVHDGAGVDEERQG